MVYGKYELLLADSNELFAYTRTLEDEGAQSSEKLLVVCSFVDHETSFTIPEEFVGASCMIANMDNQYDSKEVKLKPYEAFVLAK